MTYRTFIEDILGEAAEVARARFGTVVGRIKPDDASQVLTDTDLEIGALLIDKINGRFPDQNIIDEEAGIIDRGASYTWVIDPIDGTSNFAKAVPLYGIMLGLLRDAVPIAGGIALPSLAEMYIAERGQGAFCNGRSVSVSKDSELGRSLVAYGLNGYPVADPALTREECQLLAEIIIRSQNVRMSYSAFDLAMVAKGSYGACLGQTSRVWDNVAQDILITEAGGIYTDILGQPMDYAEALTKPAKNYTYLAAAPGIHEQLVSLTQAHRSHVRD